MSDIERLRERVRELAKSLNPRDIAAAASVSHATVYDFIAEGSTLVPQRGTRQKLTQYLTGVATAGQSRTVSRDTPASVELQAHDWRELTTALADQMDAGARMLRLMVRAGVIQGGAAVPPTAPVTRASASDDAKAQVRAKVAEKVAAKRQGERTSPPAGKRQAGGDGT